MATQQLQYRMLNTREDVERTTSLAVTACAGIGALAGAGAAIVAIAGPSDLTLTAVSALVVAAGLVLYGTGAAARAKRRYHDAGDRLQGFALVGGVAGAIVGGAGGIVLAIVALAGVLPYVVLPVAAIVLGSAAILAAPAQYTLAWLALRPERRLHHIAYRSVTWSSWALVLAGAGAIVVGTLPLVLHEYEVELAAACTIALGCALFLAAAAVAVRYGAQVPARDHERVRDEYAAQLLDLFHARFEASRTGHTLYEAVIDKLRVEDDPVYALLIPTLETFADKEHENSEYLAAQIDGFGDELAATSPLAEIEHHATKGIEELVVESPLSDPLHLLYALHAADMSDEAGWRLLMQVVDEIGHHELKKEVTVRHGDKAEQVQMLERIIEQIARRRFVAEPIAAPLSAYN